nr:hypothetical protein Itr_chr03CG12470 [Ipomoea trifida]
MHANDRLPGSRHHDPTNEQAMSNPSSTPATQPLITVHISDPSSGLVKGRNNGYFMLGMIIQLEGPEAVARMSGTSKSTLYAGVVTPLSTCKTSPGQSQLIRLQAS